MGIQYFECGCRCSWATTFSLVFNEFYLVLGISCRVLVDLIKFRKVIEQRLWKQLSLVLIIHNYSKTINALCLIHYGPVWHLPYTYVIALIAHLCSLRGYCTPGQFLDCFCIFLKNYNTLVTSKICFYR